MARLDGQRALVTGGASGLGRAFVHAFAREGARVAIADLDKAGAEAVLGEIGGRGSVFAGDVADSDTVRGWFDALGSEWGGLEILVNGAGHIDLSDDIQERGRRIAQERLSGLGQQTALDATLRLSDARWARMLAVHLTGTFFTTRAALALMTPARYGRIVNVASADALSGMPGAPHHSAAKGGVISFTKAVAREVMPFGITVNAIAPGYIDTPYLSMLDEYSRAQTVTSIPMDRYGTPEEVVPVALMFVDPDSSYLTGQVVSPNGGLVI